MGVPKVKPLVFSYREERLPHSARLAADSPFGRYYIANRGEYGFGWTRPGAFIFQGFEKTEEAAQAAAKADFERRILLSLDLSESE